MNSSGQIPETGTAAGQALVRRKCDAREKLLRNSDLEIDLLRRTANRGLESIHLSGREYALLEYLALNSNRIVSRTDIWQHVYNANATLESNVIDVFVRLLRKKIERPNRKQLLHICRGQGYMLAEMDGEE